MGVSDVRQTVIWGGALFFALVVSVPLSAADDCKPGAFHHPAFTALDHDAMVAAYRASFIAAFHREPTWKQGAGVDDGENWIRYANHYGEYSDGECRAGWNRYRELQLACNGCPTDPKLGDQPALFLPQSEPPPVVTPPIDPPPAPLPSAPACDLSALSAQLARIDAGVQAVGLDLHEHRLAEQTAWAMVRHFLGAHWTEIAAAVGGFIAAKKTAAAAGAQP